MVTVRKALKLIRDWEYKKKKVRTENKGEGNTKGQLSESEFGLGSAAHK